VDKFICMAYFTHTNGLILESHAMFFTHGTELSLNRVNLKIEHGLFF
jgi:hypothetical protein